LARGRRLVVLSNGIKDVQVPRIRNSPLAAYIEALVVSEEAGVGKPDPGIFEHACKVLGFHDKQGMLMVGDSLASDIQGGANFGIDTCWYNPGRRENSSELRPTYEVDSLAAIPGLFGHGA
jgi:HAD superfamily hydrolase (TIGR01509 family)